MSRQPKPRWPPLPRRVKGSGSIQRLADGSLRARLPRRVDPKRTSREFPPDALKQAADWLDAAIAQALGQHQHAPSTTLGDWTGFWWETSVSSIHPPNTARFALYALRKLERHYGVRLMDLKTSQLQEVVSALARKLKGNNVHKIVGVWRRCLESACDDDLMAKNVAKRLILPEKVPSLPKRGLPPAIIMILRDGIAGQRFEPAFALVLGCGLRIGEILGLYWANVEFDNHRIWIQHQYTNGHWRDLPKGRNPHWVSLPAFVEAALIRHRDQQSPGSTLVLQSPYRGKVSKLHDRPVPWSASTVSSDLTKLVKRLNLDHLTPHIGRHALASYLLDNGVAVTEIADRLGHRDTATTHRNYTHPSEEGRAKADRLINELLGSPTVGAPDTES